MPVCGTRWASIPEREPIHAQLIERSRSRAATARPGLVCPPVPPPAMTTSAVTMTGAPWSAGPPRDGLRRAQPPSPGGSLALMSLEGELDQAVDQIGVAEAGGRPHLRVGARRGEPRDRVDLVHQHAVAPTLDEEVDAGHARAIDGAEGRDRELLEAPRDLW